MSSLFSYVWNYDVVAMNLMTCPDISHVLVHDSCTYTVLILNKDEKDGVF